MPACKWAWSAVGGRGQQLEAEVSSWRQMVGAKSGEWGGGTTVQGRHAGLQSVAWQMGSQVVGYQADAHACMFVTHSAPACGRAAADSLSPPRLPCTRWSSGHGRRCTTMPMVTEQKLLQPAAPLPTSRRAAMARARPRLPLNTLELRPKGQSLAIATASSSVENLTTASRRGVVSR